MSEKRQDYISWDEYFKIPTAKWDPASSARTIKFFLLGTMVFREGAQMMFSHGAERAMNWIPSIFM